MVDESGNNMTDMPPKSRLRKALRTLVPVRFLQERAIFFRLGPNAGPIYARLQLLDWMGMRSSNLVQVSQGARSFAFVCFGNLMRSPMAEAMFRKELESVRLPGIHVVSAGLHAVPGKPAHPWALAAAQELHIPLTEHHARPLTEEMIAAADAVFAMDFQNKAELLARYPESKNKIFMMSVYANGSQRGREIQDPYFGSLVGTRECYAVLQTCIRNLTAALLARQASGTVEASSP